MGFKKRYNLIVLISFILLLNGCAKGNLKVDDNKMFINISNGYGNVQIEDEKLAYDLINVVEDKRNMQRVGCGFHNKTTIIKNGQVVKSFVIADDGCPTILMDDNTMFVMPNELYNRLELLMQKHNNSLVAHGVGNLIYWMKKMIISKQCFLKYTW